MSAYTPPEKNLAIFDPSVFNDTAGGSGGLTEAQADARYLRFPTAQGTEDLLDVNVNGLATFKNNVVIQDASSNSATMSIDPSGSLNISGSSGIIKTNEQLLFTSTAGVDRQIFTSYYNFYDSNTSTLDLKGRIFSSGNTCFFGMNLVDNSTLSFLIRSGGVNYTPLSLTRNATFNSNIIQSNLANIITQDAITADLSSNIFKRSEIKTNFGGGSNNPSNTSALDVYESVSGRGFRFVSDASGNSSYNDLTISRDSVLVSRFRPTSSTLGLVVGLNDAGGTGIRFSSATATKGRVQIQSGTTNTINVYDDSDVTYPNTTTYNRAIRMIGTDVNSRNIVDAGVISMKDLGGTSASAGLYVSGGSSQVVYVANNSGYKHSFYAIDASGNPQERFNISNTNITASAPIINTFSGSFANTEIGYSASVNSVVFTATSTPLAWTSSNSNLVNYLSVTLAHPGTYILYLTLYFYNTSTSGFCSLSHYYLGLSTGTTLSNTGTFASSVMKSRTGGNLSTANAGPPVTLSPSGSIQLSSSCVYRATEITTIKFLGWADYVSGTFNAQVNIAYVKVA